MANWVWQRTGSELETGRGPGTTGSDLESEMGLGTDWVQLIERNRKPGPGRTVYFFLIVVKVT